MKNLHVLYLHDNLIGQWNDLVSIKEAPQLVHVTLSRNPVCQIPGYRHQMVNQIKHLKALDDFIITDEERIDFTSPVSVRFRALSQFMKINIPKFKENLSADEHLFNIEVDLYRLRRLYERNCPSIRIQSYYRGYLLRSKSYFSYTDRRKAAVKIQKVVRGWLYRIKIKKELQSLLKAKAMDYLMYTQDEYRRYQAFRTIGRAIFRFARKRRRERLLNYSATIIQTYWRGKHTKHSSFIRALKMHEYNKIYFLKEQKLDFYRVLKHALVINKQIKSKYSFDQLKTEIKQPSDYLLIRYPNPLTFKRHDLPILQLIMPSLECKVKQNCVGGLSKLIAKGKRVTNFYTRFSGMDLQSERITKLKKRFCHFNVKDTSLIIEKGQSIYQSMKMKKVYDNYQELLVFDHPDPELLEAICQALFFTNRDLQNENFLPFFPYLMDRVSSAIKIQQSFRAFLIRKAQKEDFHYQEDKTLYPVQEAYFAKAVIQHRASQCISQWWKYFRLRRRLEALTTIKGYLRTIDRPTLYIEETIYMHLDLILGKSSTQLKFLEQQMSFDFKHPSQSVVHQKNPPSSILEQKKQELTVSTASYQSDGNDDLTWHVTYQNTGSISLRFQDEAFPKWLTAEIPDYNIYKYNDDQMSIFFNSFLGIIHKASIDIMPVIRDFNEIVDSNNKSMTLNNGLNFLSINCMSLYEAKKRALIVAILTYDMKRKTFLKFFTSRSMCDGVFLKNLYDIWKQYEIAEDYDQRMKALINKQIESIDLHTIRERQKHQQHTGLAVNHKDRWNVEGHHLMRFHEVEKPKSNWSHQTTRQRQLATKQKDLLYLSWQFPADEEMNKIEIKIDNLIPTVQMSGGLDIRDSTPTPMNNMVPRNIGNIPKLPSQNGSTIKGHHLYQKEPISTLKNISLNDILPTDFNNGKVQISKQYDLANLPTSTKSGTAWPGNRLHQPYGYSPNASIILSNAGDFTSKQQSIKNFFSLRKSSNLNASTNAGSQLPSGGHTTPLTALPGHRYSAFISRKSDNTLLIGEEENWSLIKQAREEGEWARDRLREQRLTEQIVKKDEISKVKQVNQIMKKVVKVEQEANIQMYQRFNKEEKELLKDLKSKDNERIINEQQTKRQIVQMHHFQKRQKSEEREFALSFSQVRNLISKQSRIGEVMKIKNTINKQKREIVKDIKHQEQSFIDHKNQMQNHQYHPSKHHSLQRLHLRQPISSTLFDSQQIQEMTFHKQLPMTVNNSPHRSSGSSNQLMAKGLRASGSMEQRFQPRIITSAQENINNSQLQQRIFDPTPIAQQLPNKNKKISYSNNNSKQRGQRISFIEENFPLNGVDQMVGKKQLNLIQ